jgi:hypothetical protein
MLDLRRASAPGLSEPGTWELSARSGAPTALVCCPWCRQWASLSSHTISADGTVSPSLVCPAPACGFHDHVRLAGWAAAVAPDPKAPATR